VPKSLEHNLEILRFSSVKVETTFFKRYYNSIWLLMQLSKSERILLDFLVEKMDDFNYVSNTKQLRNTINKTLCKIGFEAYADNTFHKGFKSLTELSLIIKKQGRGLYQVNPLYFFVGTEEERQQEIRKNLEEINRIPINKERHRILSKMPDHKI